MTKRKIMLLAMALCMVAILAVGGTLAYFTDTDSADNVFTVGNVDIDLTEPNWETVGKDEAPEVYPGEAIAKDPTITNNGANPCFVRIKITGWDSLIDAELSKNLIGFRTDYVDNKLGENWVCPDGYNEADDSYIFYYNKVLTVGSTTDALFDQIVLPFDLVNGDTNFTDEQKDDPTYNPEYHIEVYAEAVQAQGAKPSFSAVEAMTVEEIAAWFATCGFSLAIPTPGA